MKIEGISPQTFLNITGFTDILKNLNIGDKLKVQVVGIDGKELTLRLPNGISVSATSVFPLDLFLGDFIELSVKGKNDNQIIVQTLNDSIDESKTKEVKDTLSKISLPPNERNINIGKSLINQHFPVNKENISKIIALLSKYEGLDVEKAAFILANNIDEINDGFGLLAKYAENEADIGRSIANLIKILNAPDNSQTLENIIKNDEAQKISNLISDENENISGIIQNYNGDAEQDAKLIQSFVKQAVNQSNNMPKDLETLTSGRFTDRRLEFILKYDDNKQIFDFIDANPNIKDALLKFLNDKQSISKFVLEYVKSNNVLETKLHGEGKHLNNIVDYFKDIFNVVKKEGLKSELDVNNVYNSLLDKLNTIEGNIASSNSVRTEEVLQNISQIKDYISFSSNVNNLFSFYQLPLAINNHNTSMDLYVAKNPSRSKKIDPDNVSIFISLSTKNFGIVESLINVLFGKVNIDFRLEDDDTISVFQKNKTVMEDLINNIGYTAGKISFSICPKKTDILSFEHLIRKESDILKDVFDVRV